uniref:Uncharacterized protein n=1 Tax=Sphaerodactylus townsendi TaxID=933632 RepID=A0ACB8FXC6_9SAUR
MLILASRWPGAISYCCWPCQSSLKFIHETCREAQQDKARDNSLFLGYADDWSLEDALTDQPTKRPTHKPKKLSSSGTGDFDLSDYFDDPLETTTKPAKVTTGPYPKKPDDSRWNVQYTTTTRHPKTTKTPPKKHPTKDPMDFDLSDALKDSDDGQGGGAPIVNPGGGSKGRGGRGGKPGISDEDLAGILDDGKYQPDKKKGGSGGGSSDSNYNEGALIETGTIAGIVSGLAMALIGAVSSYISYQQKKFCFSIQRPSIVSEIAGAVGAYFEFSSFWD